MNLRTTYLLFAAVAALLVVFILAITFGGRGDADEYLLRSFRELVRNEKQLADLRKEIQRVEIERLQPAGETIAFVRDDDKNWKLQAPYVGRIESHLVEDIVRQLTSAKLDKTAEVGRLQQHGLDSPAAAVTLFKGEEKFRVAFGKVTSGGRSAVVYAIEGARAKTALAVRRSEVDSLFRSSVADAAHAGEAIKGIADFRPRHLLADGSPAPWDIVQQIRIKEGHKELTLQRNAIGGWNFIKPEGYGAADLEGDVVGPATENLGGVKPLLTAVANWRIAKPEDVIEGVSDFAAYGLQPGQEAWRVEIIRQQGGSEIFLVGNKVDEKGEKRYCRRDGERFVIALETKALEPVRRVLDKPAQLRDRNLVQFSSLTVDAVDIRIRNQPLLELRRIGDPPQWRAFEGGSAEAELANHAVVIQLLDAITQRRIVLDFPDSAVTLDPQYGLNDPEAQISIWQSGIEPEKKEDLKPSDNKGASLKKPKLKGDPTIRLNFGKKDKNAVYVRRFIGPSSTVLSIPVAVLDSVTRPASDYIELIMPTFDSTKAARLSFSRDGKRYEVEKQGTEPQASWVFAQPVQLKGRHADATRISQIILNLSNLQGATLVTKRPTDAELEKFGLKPPKVDISVTLMGETQPRQFLFGAEIMGSYYARVAPQERVYRVSRHTIDALVAGEIEDPTLLRFDRTKVKSVKLAGWKNVGGKVVALNLERKSESEWSAAAQPGYKVDAVYAEQFLQMLAQLRGERFIKNKGGPESEHKLDVERDALFIEIAVEGEKEPLSLTVGALDKEGKQQFVQSSRMPGAVLVVDKERFAGVMASPDVFRKK